MKISKLVPLWIKEPMYIYMRERKKLPPSIARQHALCDLADIRYPGTDKRIDYYINAHHVIYAYLESRFNDIFEKYQYEEGTFVENAPIWLFWWQGEEKCPDTVRLCIDSIRKHAGKHPVVIITEKNFKEYVSLPEYILEKQRSGIVSLTHFSDILRMNLLADHGGYWMDATIFCTRDISEECFQYPIFTGKNPQERYENISHWKWTGYAIAGYKNNSLFVLAKDIFNKYWEKQNALIDYFLIDYVVRMIYEHVLQVKNMLDSLPNNNEHQMYLHACMNDVYTSEKMNQLMSDSTWLYKLTWKASYQTEIDGKRTIYGHLLEQLNCNK